LVVLPFCVFIFEKSFVKFSQVSCLVLLFVFRLCYTANNHISGGAFMATMEEIAKALGLSKGTVSKALSGAKDVGEATRQTVMERLWSWATPGR
jgi:DNA-binding CsgD family transcriptional regulator